jgi:multiple sugar transport system permease protein
MTMKNKRDKYKSAKFIKNVIVSAVKYVLLTGLSFIILYPLIIKLSTSFMSQQDLVDSLVSFIPRKFTLTSYKLAADYTKYFEGLKNTFLISFLCGVLQMIVCTFVGYGLARFKFKGRNIVMGLVLFTILAPPQTYMISMYLKFRYFDIFHIAQAATGAPINLLDSMWPMIILSITGFGFKNGLYIFMMRQYFKNIPEELEEAAFVDGSGVFRTFFKIIMPLSTSMMVTVFLFSFSWQWTDTFYSSMFFSRIRTLSNSLLVGFEGMMLEGNTLSLKNGQPMTIALVGTMSLMVLAPLIIVYIFAQKSLTEGIERSGIVG